MSVPAIADPRRRRLALAFVATALFAAVAEGCGGAASAAADRPRDGRGATDSGSAMLSLNGVTLAVPDGWDSESFVNASGISVFRVGSFSFPHGRDDDVGQRARDSMSADDVLINIIDFTPTDPGEGNSYYRPLTPPLIV